jgi:heat-inducible transcriptional repressor
VEEYVSTGSLVGSKMLVHRAGLEVSSSTVRNELAQLEELGLLSHPHTSAGRVPTDLGYRFFVDRVIEALEPRPAEPELSLDFSALKSEVEGALRATTEALAEMTHLLALVSAPPLETTAVRRVEVILLQPQLVLVVLITATGGVTKRLFRFDEPVDTGLADWARAYLNESLAGLRLGTALVRRRFEDPGLSPRERVFLDTVRPAFVQALDDSGAQLYVGGVAGLLGEARSSELDSYQRLLEVLETRAAALELLSEALEPRQPLVRLGSDFENPSLQGAAFVSASYGLAHRSLGAVGLLGPVRMDYDKAIRTVRAAAHELSRFVEDLYET